MPGVSCLYAINHLIALFYVDDIILIYIENNKSTAEKLIEKIMRIYQTKPLGQINHFLGTRVVRDEEKRKIWLVQDCCINSIAKEFNVNINNTNVPSTPFPTFQLTINDSKATAKEIYHYQKRVVKLSYAAALKRPDITYGVSKVSEFLQNPTQKLLDAAEHMMQAW